MCVQGWSVSTDLLKILNYLLAIMRVLVCLSSNSSWKLLFGFWALAGAKLSVGSLKPLYSNKLCGENYPN